MPRSNQVPISVLAPLLGGVVSTGRFGLFVASIGQAVRRGPLYLREIFQQTITCIFRCFLPVCAVIGPFGMIIGVQGAAILDLFGAHTTLPSLLVIVMLREVAPVMAGIMLALQAGSGFAGELGTMRVRSELDATEIMAVDPLLFQVVPRITAIFLTAPLLYTLGGAVGIVGGWVTSVGPQLSHGTFVANLFNFMTPMDIWGGVIKSTFFGLLVGTIACYQGFHATRGSRGVARATNRAVVWGVLLTVITNYFLSSILYGAFGD